MIDDTHGLKINRMAVSPNGTRIAIQFEGFAHFVVLRADRAQGRDPGDFDVTTAHATFDEVREWVQVSLGWQEHKVVQTVPFHEPVEPTITPLTPPNYKTDARPFRSEGAAALRELPESTATPDTHTVTFRPGDGPQIWYVDAEGADRLDAGLLLETGPGSYNSRVASPRRLAILGALLGLASRRLTEKSREGKQA